MISNALLPYLRDLEERIDPDGEERLIAEWRAFSRGEAPSPIFSPCRSYSAPPTLPWPQICVNAALEDYDAMVLQQLGGASTELEAGGGLLLNARCNFGSSILPSLFGVEHYIMEDALNTLPTSRPLNNEKAIQRLVDSPPPSLAVGWGCRVFRMGERFTEIAAAFPKIGRYVHIYHPDCQGPLDACEVIWGSSLFYALYDSPNLVHGLLEKITSTYIRFMRAWADQFPFQPDGNCHWGFFHQGSLMLRDDSAMNLSPDMVAEFVLPYDQRLLDAFGGGAIHFCGRGDHFITALANMRGLTAVNLSQPELNRMETVYASTVDRGINLLGLPRTAAKSALAHGRDLHQRVHCTG